ncbi:MAG: hypothetical protein AAGI46_01675 [Planctomycetota bacterium]
MKKLALKPLSTPDQLHAWVKLFCGLDVPRTALCPKHDAPFDYLVRAYFEPARDLVVWAPRGGGKTRLAAVATLLDLLHKPGTAVRLLGGSLEQSLKMWDYLLPDLVRVGRLLLPDGKLPRESTRKVKLTNGSTAAVLTQSQRAVRGLRVQKLRCDEVELFDDNVWEAAQLATRSTEHATAAIEAASTHHKSGGLMGRVIDNAAGRDAAVVRWCLLDVLQPCPATRDCDKCVLFDECRGRAKERTSGFVSIDDAVRMKGRVSVETWQAEMLCRRPSTRGRVFGSFNEDVHVRPFDGDAEDMAIGVDFGFAAPFVALWIATIGDVRHVVDEYVQPGRTVPEHAAELSSRDWPARQIYCDPAGAAVVGQTGASDAAVLRRAGFKVRFRASRIAEGLELIRRDLKPADGSLPRLLIDPRCKRLIEAMRSYHYPDTGGELPQKDGTHDHSIDALRYALIHLARPVTITGGGLY